jgi:translocation and assembly module TamA
MIAGFFKFNAWPIRTFGGSCLLALAVCTSSAQTGGESGVKTLNIVLTGVDQDLRRNIEGFTEIFAFNENQVPSIARLRYLHNRAESQIEAALRPFGYYRPVVESELFETGSRWQAVYRVEPRDRVAIVSEPVIELENVVVDCNDFRYRRRDRKSLLPEVVVEDDDFNRDKDLVVDFCEARAAANLVKGRSLDQQAYDKLKQVIQTSAARYGYFDAEFTQQEIRIDLEAYTAEIALVMNPGTRYRIGEAVITQDIDWINDNLLERYVELEDQDYFNAGELQALQSDLTNSDYYKRVEVRASAQDAVDEVVPVRVDLTHIKPREYVVGLGYGTDTGARFRLGVDGRRVNSRGHHYTAEGRVSEIGYALVAGYKIPTGDPRSDSYGIRLGIEREDTDAQNFRGFTLGANYQFRDGLWFKTYAIDYNVNEFFVEDETTITRLLMPSLEWTRTFPVELEKRINTVNGAWVRLSLRGAAESLLSDTSFIQPQLSTKLIKTFSNQNRFIARASVGTTWVKDFDLLPTQLRYYAGGDTSVRGYNYQAISPLDADNKVIGARHLIEASAEYEVPVRENFSVAAFADVGDAFDNQPEFRAGLGVGLRWQSPIGPVRVDVARSLDDPGEGNVRLHLSLGPDL